MKLNVTIKQIVSSIWELIIILSFITVMILVGILIGTTNVDYSVIKFKEYFSWTYKLIELLTVINILIVVLTIKIKKDE